MKVRYKDGRLAFSNGHGWYGPKYLKLIYGTYRRVYWKLFLCFMGRHIYTDSVFVTKENGIIMKKSCMCCGKEKIDNANAKIYSD